jgi:phage-related minor tail protein
MFPMAGGKTGLAGEAGKEAILPLTRTPSGDLGVRTTGASRTIVNVYAPEGSKVSQDSQQNGNTEMINVYIDEAVAGNIGKPGSKTHRMLRNTFGVGQTLTKR